ncbi:DUF433 domain-containing protein [candidate division KSB1 bacterium]|nr:DUF433 domain-containing protein [candidate division KSB1 bacterium]
MPQRRNGRLKNGRLKKRIEIGEHLVRDPEIYHGELTFKGTRVPVSVVLAYLAKGISVDEVPQHWPDVSPDAAKEALMLAREAMLEKYQKAA